MQSTIQSTSLATNLSCSRCKQTYDIHQIHTFSPCCDKPFLVDYDFSAVPEKEELKNRRQDMWRYQEFLPVFEPENIVTLGEGFTPVRLFEKFKNVDIYLKDESYNPSGSFKARGIGMAVSKAKELGVTQCIVPTAGNAGSALAVFCAKAGIKATVVMPSHTPAIFIQECKLHGAEVILMDGLISDCGKMVAEIKKETGAFDISTLKEPYRIEGKKTMGYEIAEQFNWQLPDVIVYPTGGGTGLIGIWKAFREMKKMGWIEGKLPRMVAVQSEACQPVVKAYASFTGQKNEYDQPSASVANGLAVPFPFGMDLMMEVLTESNGTAIALSEEEIIHANIEAAQQKGTLMAPEGAAVWKATQKLIDSGWIAANEKVLILNTGTGYKYLDNIIARS
jgi:threonine synthase